MWVKVDRADEGRRLIFGRLDNEPNPAAVALVRKGGKARAARLKPKNSGVKAHGGSCWHASLPSSNKDTPVRGMKLLLAIATLALAWAAPQASLDAAVQLATSGRLREAEAMFLALEKQSPKDAELQFRFGVALIKTGKLDQARRHLETAARLDPRLPNVRPALGLLHEALARQAKAKKDAPAAAKELQEAIRLDPGRAPYYLELAQLLLDHDLGEPAEVVLRNAAQRFPPHPEVWRLLGLACFAQGKNPDAIDAFLKAIDADPGQEASYASLESLLPEARERLPEIVAKLRVFVAQHPESPVGPFLLALAVPSEAAALLRRAMEAAPEFWPAYFEFHKLLKAEGKWPEAAAMLEKTVSLNPGHAPAHYALAEYYNHIGDRTRAAAERELHHKLLAEQRQETERRRARAPRMEYQIEGR